MYLAPKQIEQQIFVFCLVSYRGLKLRSLSLDIKVLRNISQK